MELRKAACAAVLLAGTASAQVRVTAARVVHPMVEHAYAYRFDARDRSVVISGDTTYAPALVDLARGAAVLVHEILYPPGVEALLRKHLGGRIVVGKDLMEVRQERSRDARPARSAPGRGCAPLRGRQPAGRRRCRG